MKTCSWLLLVVCLIAPAAIAQDEVEPAEPFLIKNYTPGEDGFWTEKPSGPSAFLAYSYALLATGFCLGPIFKSARRTHLD